MPGPKPRKFTTAERAEIKRLYTSHKRNITQLRKDYHTTEANIEAALAAEGVSVRRVGRPAAGRTHVKGCMAHLGGACMPRCG